jgi:predicted PurR-regulated permease PerM
MSVRGRSSRGISVWRAAGYDIYRTGGGYESGNLLNSLIAGMTSGGILVALGVPYAVALGLVKAFLDLIPLAGATIAAIVASATQGLTIGVIVAIYFLVYQQLEDHLLQPFGLGRMVQQQPSPGVFWGRMDVTGPGQPRRPGPLDGEDRPFGL